MALDTASRLICLPSFHSKAFQAANFLPEQARGCAGGLLTLCGLGLLGHCGMLKGSLQLSHSCASGSQPQWATNLALEAAKRCLINSG